MNFYQQDNVRKQAEFEAQLAVCSTCDGEGIVEKREMFDTRKWHECMVDCPDCTPKYPIYKGQTSVLTPEMKAKFTEAGILARPISATEYLLVYPGNVFIVMKG